MILLDPIPPESFVQKRLKIVRRANRVVVVRRAGLDREEQRRRFLELYGYPRPTLPPRRSYREHVLGRPLPQDSENSGREEAARIGRWIDELERQRPRTDKSEFTSRQNDALEALVTVLQSIAEQLEAVGAELPEALTERHLTVMSDVARAFGAELTRNMQGQRKTPTGIAASISQWVPIRRALGSKDALRSAGSGLETGVQRGYAPKVFEVLTRIREATEAQIFQRGRALAARHLRVPVDRVVVRDGQFFDGGDSARHGIDVEWARSRMKTIHWQKIQRHVRSSYVSAGEPVPLGRVLTGSVENFTRWLVRHGGGLLEELPDRLPRSCRTTEEGLALRRRRPRRHRSDLDMRLPLAVFLLSRARPGSSAGSGPWST
jgi:hypothetical protein